jgi:autotransporter-associated beta strand protein
LVTNNITGVITGGVGGAGFGGTATLGPGIAGFGGAGLLSSGGGVVTNVGLVNGGAGAGGTVQTVGGRPGVEFSNGQNSFEGGSGGLGMSNGGTSGAPGGIVNNATGVIAGGRGGDGTSGLVNAASPHVAAGAGGGGGGGVSITSGSIVNFGQIAGGAAGNGANATVAGQVGGSDPFNGGGIGVSMNGVFFQSVTMSLDNRAGGTITGGVGSTPGTSGAGAAGAKGGDGGLGVDAVKPVTGTLTILNAGQITGGNGAAGSAGTPNGANGVGGVGVRMRGDGTITTSGAISGGLNGDGATRANAITLLSGVHTLTLQTGATFAGNVVVDTAAPSNPGVAASNTLSLDGASTGAVSLPQFQNFGHLTQTSGSGGTWTLSGAGTITVDTTISAGTMVLNAGSVLTSPTVDVLTGGILSLSTAALANDALNINGGTLRVTGTGLTSLPNTISMGANGATFDIASAANTFAQSQALSGSGALTKVGAGTLALTGTNTYSGGTTVSAGTLQLGAGGTAGAIAGNVTNNANLTFNRSDAVTFGGVISGSGTVQHNGSGVTTLTGISTYSGTTTINAGTLLVNGSIVSPSQVNSGGTLGGTGVLGAVNVASGGTFAPGNSIGTVTVNGGLTFTGGSNYAVELSPATSDRTNVTGTATLGGATVNASFAAGGYVSKQYTLINATAVTGTFGTLVNTNLPAGFTASLSQNANNAFLDLAMIVAPTPTPGTPGLVAFNLNQLNVANALINSFNTAGGIPIVFGTLTPTGLTQISGEGATATQQATFDAMGIFLGLLTDPFIAGRGDIGSAGGGAGATSLAKRTAATSAPSPGSARRSMRAARPLPKSH